LQIEQHQVGLFIARFGETFHPVASLEDGVTRRLEDVFNEKFPIFLTVIDDQNLLACHVCLVYLDEALTAASIVSIVVFARVCCNQANRATSRRRANAVLQAGERRGRSAPPYTISISRT
jgi:hypothetical protein